MTLPAAGWYADPTLPADSGRLRYWDGAAWTEQVHVQSSAPTAYPGPPAAPAPYPGQPNPTAGYPGQPAAAPAYPSYQPQPGYAQAWAPAVPSTPDGAKLAGWWWRVLAQFIDGFILTPILFLFLAPVVASQWDEITGWFDALSVAAENGTGTPALPDIFNPTTGAGLAMILIPIVLSFTYSVVFLRWKQATPGKLAVGLRVRLRDRPGPLPWGTILARVGFVTGLSVMAQIPLIGIPFGIASLLDLLWPLWDSKKQALHDKVARTNVITLR